MLDSLITHIHSSANFLSLEITPSLSASLDSKLLYSLKSFQKVTCFVCTDSPLARLKPSPILSSFKLQNALQKPVICTLSMRDRNSIALCGDILAANELGVRAFLSLTGDPINLGDCKESKGVFEDNSLKLAQIITSLNEGYAFNGKELASKVQKIYNFHTLNSYANNMDTLVNKMSKKLASSECEGFFTQPVYERKSAEFLLHNLQKLNAKYNRNVELILGYYPILSFKAALFLRDKLPGVFVPEEFITRLESAAKIGKEEEEKVGFELSSKLLLELQTLSNKFHFMNPDKFKLFEHFF